jgi:hypothetical protein
VGLHAGLQFHDKAVVAADAEHLFVRQRGDLNSEFLKLFRDRAVIEAGDVDGKLIHARSRACTKVGRASRPAADVHVGIGSNRRAGRRTSGADVDVHPTYCSICVTQSTSGFARSSAATASA